MLGFSSLASVATADDGVAESSAVFGDVSANISLTLSATALARISALTTATLPFAGLASGTAGPATSTGGATGGIAFAGAALGQARIRASGSGGFAIICQGVGATRVRGSVTGLLPILGAGMIGNGPLAGRRAALPGASATGGRLRPSRTGGTLAWTRNGCRIVRDT